MIVFKILKVSKVIVGRNVFLIFIESVWVRLSNKKFINRFNVWFKKLNENGNNIWNSWLIVDRLVIVDRSIIMIFVKYIVFMSMICVIFWKNNCGILFKNWLILIFVCVMNNRSFVKKGRI